MAFGAALGSGIKDAVELWYRMKQDRFDRERQAQADSRAQAQLDMTRNQYEANTRRLDLGEDREGAQFLINNFSGQKVDDGGSDLIRRAGYGSALEPEMTLGGKRMPAYFDPQAPAQGFTEPIPQSETGNEIIKPTQSEKMRIELAKANAAQSRLTQTLNSREGIEQAKLVQRRDDMRMRQAIATNAQHLQRYGIDVRSADAQRAIAHQIALASSLMDDRTFDNQVSAMEANPLAIIQMLQGGGAGMPQAPQLQYQPPYWQPPVGGQGPATGGPQRFEEIP